MDNIVIQTIKKIIGNNYLPCLQGTISDCGTDDCKMEDRGGVYGFAVQLTKEEAEEFFQAANDKNENYRRKGKVKFEDWKPLNDKYYPLYWGHDSDLGHRLINHTKALATTYTIQLNKRPFLKGRTVIYGAALCSAPSEQEEELRKKYPDILKNYIIDN